MKKKNSPQVNPTVEKMIIGRHLGYSYKTKLFLRTVFTISLILIVFMLGVFASLYLMNVKGGFTVLIDKTVSNRKAICLSTDVEFSEPTTNLKFDEPASLENLSYIDVPDSFDETVFNEGYVAYTFYLKNSGQEAAKVCCQIEVKNVTKKCDEAVRIKVIKNGVPETYAKLGKYGIPEEGTLPFYSEGIAYDDEIEALAPGEIIKYTIVVWFDGDDPECVSAIRGAQLTLEMSFGIVENTTE